MAKVATMELKRGDGLTDSLLIPIANWAAGGTLRLTAKLIPDNDPTDAAAVVNKTFDDSSVSLTSNPGYAAYTLAFIPTDITNVSFTGGTTKLKFKGEFQFTPSGGLPTSFPGDDNYIEVIIYADIAREAP